MAARPSKQIGNGTVLRATVKATKSATAGYGVALNTDGTVENVAAGAFSIGVFLETKAAGKLVEFVANGPLAPVKIGTGGATVGKLSVSVADGFTDSATIGGGTVLKNPAGVFWEGGVAGDDGSMIVLPFQTVSA